MAGVAGQVVIGNLVRRAAFTRRDRGNAGLGPRLVIGRIAHRFLATPHRARIRTLGPPWEPVSNSGTSGEDPASRQGGADREPETWCQGPAAIRCVTESRAGVRKVW